MKIWKDRKERRRRKKERGRKETQKEREWGIQDKMGIMREKKYINKGRGTQVEEIQKEARGWGDRDGEDEFVCCCCFMF